jgi:hypothetical protein
MKERMQVFIGDEHAQYIVFQIEILQPHDVAGDAKQTISIK